MKVLLKANWYIGGRRFRRQPEGNEIPDALREYLPTSAVILVESTPEPAPDRQPATLASAAFKEALHANDGQPLMGVAADAETESAIVAAEAAASKKRKK